MVRSWRWFRIAAVGGVLGAGGCRQLLGLDDVPADGAIVVDTAPDVAIDGPSCVGSLASLCFDPAMLGTELKLEAEVIDTDADARCVVVGQGSADPELCMLAATTVKVGGTVTIHGSRPLVLVATTTLDVAGRLDGSSTIGGTKGPGASACASADGAALTTGGGGGGGGSLGGMGGGGGNGATGSLGGAAIAAPTITSVRAGCAGGKGGDGNGTLGGLGGASGGAIYLIAETITISAAGSVLVGGAGGAHGMIESAGGGGGSGGLIALEATTINTMGVIAAKGGGGGEGAGNGTGNPGANAGLPLATPAAGGLGGSPSGGDGGAGAAGATINGTPGNVGTMGANGGGGGGGGGGAGVIWVKGTFTGAQVFPPPSIQ